MHDWQLWNVLKLISTPTVTPALFGGILLGYVMYDVTHYYVHHGQPKSQVPRSLKVKYNKRHDTSLFMKLLYAMIMFLLYFMQKYHLNHHFRIQNKGYGITSSLWDKVFGTLPQTKSAEKEMKQMQMQ